MLIRSETKLFARWPALLGTVAATVVTTTLVRATIQNL